MNIFETQAKLRNLQELLKYAQSDDEAFQINEQCAEMRRLLRERKGKERWNREKLRSVASQSRIPRCDTRYSVEGE